MKKFLLAFFPALVLLTGCATSAPQTSDDPRGRYQFQDDREDAEKLREERRFNAFP